MSSVILKQAVALHRAGRLAQAETLYRRVLAGDPDNPDALHYLGLIAHQSGRQEEAVALIQEAIARRPAATYWYNLAHAYLASKNLPRAEEALQRTIAMEPGHAEALFHLGSLRSQAGDLTAAVGYYRQAIEYRPDFVDAHVNLGLLLDRTGETDSALSQLEQARRLRPEDCEISNNIGIVRSRVARTEAVGDFRRALSLNPQHVGAKINLGKLLARLGQHSEAADLLSTALEHKPEDADAHAILANSLAELNRLDDAVRHCETAVAASPRSLRPLVSLGNLYRRIGRFDDAYRCFRDAQERDPGNCDALVGILKHLKSRVSREEAERVMRLAEDPSLSMPERRQLHFALAGCLEAKGDYDAAFLHMDRGNLLRRLEFEPQYGAFDLAKEVARVDRIITTFDEKHFRCTGGFGVVSDIPVFVVGMPRSGTTLCEQILASHSRVFGAGELPDIGRIERELVQRYRDDSAGSAPSEYAAHLSPDLVRSIAQSHLTRLQRLAPTALRVVDKMPVNYYRLGVIATLFPKAKVIHCRRDPMDVGLSCYSKDFVNFPIWASDLRSIGHVYRQHDRLMGHWRRVLPIEIFEFQYETIVHDLEGSARALIRYCGLEWEDACLEFYQTDRHVRTASHEQVRQPIYDTSVGRWQKFKQYLGALQEVLTGRD